MKREYTALKVKDDRSKSFAGGARGFVKHNQLFIRRGGRYQKLSVEKKASLSVDKWEKSGREGEKLHASGRFFNPFLSAHIPYAQSEGILPKYGLLR